MKGGGFGRLRHVKWRKNRFGRVCPDSGRIGNTSGSIPETVDVALVTGKALSGRFVWGSLDIFGIT